MRMDSLLRNSSIKNFFKSNFIVHLDDCQGGQDDLLYAAEILIPHHLCLLPPSEHLKYRAVIGRHWAMLACDWLTSGPGTLWSNSGTCIRCLSSMLRLAALQSRTSAKGSCQPLERMTGRQPACRVSRNRKLPRRRPRGTRQNVEFDRRLS